MMNDTEYYMSDITVLLLFFFSSRRRHTRSLRDWSSDVCSSDLTATNQRGEVAIDWARWVMVHKRDQDAPEPETVVPELADAVAAEDLVIPDGLDFSSYDVAAAGEPHRWDEYEVGEKIDHVDGVTLTDPEHMLA